MAKAQSAIEKELLAATGIKRRVAEPFQKYAGRLIEAIGELPNDDWEGLSKEAQDWNNVGAKAIKADKDVAEFPGAEPEPEEDEKSSRKASTRETSGRSTRRAAKDEEPEEERKPAKKAAARTSSKKDDDEGGGSRKVGAQLLIKQMLAKNPKLSPEDLMDRLTKKGYAPTPLAVSSIRSSFRNSMMVLKDAGMLDVEL